jgi:hypothetical protein
MISAFSTSHFRARRNLRSSASGWSCFTILQKALRNSSGGVFAMAALNSAVWPNLSSSADMDNELRSEVVEELVDLASALLSSLFRLKTFSRLFFFSFFPSFSDAASLDGAATAVSAPPASSTATSTPNTLNDMAHSSRSLFSSSAVSVPGRPGGVFGAMTRYEWVRSATSKSIAESRLAVLSSGDVLTKGTSSAPPIAMPKTMATVQPVPLVW